MNIIIYFYKTVSSGLKMTVFFTCKLALSSCKMFEITDKMTNIGAMLCGVIKTNAMSHAEQ